MTFRYASFATAAALMAGVAVACAITAEPVVANDWGATVNVGGSKANSDRRPSRATTSGIVTGSTKAAPASADRSAGNVVAPSDRPGPAPSNPVEAVRPTERQPSEVRSASLPDDKRLANACTLLMDEATKTALEAERRSILEATQELVRQSDLIDQRIQVLKEWMDKRDLLVRKVNKLVVDTYAKMKPEAAAVQLAAMDLGQAGAIASKLEPDKLSAIVSEMDPGKGAAILAALSGAVAPEDVPARGR